MAMREAVRHPAAADAWRRRLVVDLTGAEPIARGHMRLVFEHPEFPGALIKVVDPAFVDDKGQLTSKYLRRRAWLKRRIGGFLAVKRELGEFLVARTTLDGDDWPIARIFGFVETGLGLGLVVEKISDPDGGLAPTLDQMLSTKRFKAVHRPLLARLFDELAERHICIGNMHVRNIVLAGTPGEGGRFVGIDGLGEKAAIPLADWSKRFNALQVRRRACAIFKSVNRRAGKCAPETAYG
jgi:hypothetical protein